MKDSKVKKLSLKLINGGPTDNMPALAYIMAWWLLVDKPLSQPAIGLTYLHIYASLSLDDLTQ